MSQNTYSISKSNISQLNNNLTVNSDNFEDKLMNSMLQFYGSGNTSFNQIEDIFKMIQNLINEEHNTIEYKLKSFISKNGRNNENDTKIIEEISNIFKSTNNTLNKFNTEYNRSHFLE